MSYVRRQRFSWARIKLSNLIWLLTSSTLFLSSSFRELWFVFSSFELRLFIVLYSTVSIWLFDRNSLGFSYFSLFTFQCTLALSFRVLLYYTKRIIVCQHFFKTFLFYFFEQIFINKYLFFSRVDNDYINTHIDKSQQVFLVFYFIFSLVRKRYISSIFAGFVSR